MGAVEAGSLGVRGFVSEVHGETHEGRVEVLTRALEELKLGAARRVHIMAQPGSEKYEAAYAAGFRACPGESLFQRILEERPTIRQECPHGFIMRDGTVKDLLNIQTQLSHVKEVAFQGWEILLIERQRGQANRFFKVIEYNSAIVGVSIGGSHENRGTITHTWVAEEHRNHKLGQTLSDASLQALYDGGARIAHLMTTANNVLAEKFWERQGFVRETHHKFLEIDL
jgi:ribosomal protein S18 acetylase RimI-like enzyme